jgi:predicted CopG family antitoxin
VVKVSFKTIKRLLNFKKKKPSRFVGSWEMDEKEAEELKKELRIYHRPEVS